MKDLTKEWVSKAEKDFLVAKRELFSDPPEYDSVSFHRQQCVEKYLKAVLQDKEIFFEKIHDLDILVEKIISFLPELGSLREDIIELSSFAVEVRYPGVEATASDAKMCFSTTQKVRRIISSYFNLPISD